MAQFFRVGLSAGYDVAIQQGFAFLGDSARIAPGDRVAIKPNLTFPTYRPGVMTNPEAVGSLIKYLKNFTDRITICESDSGGYNKFCMDEVFRVTGIEEMSRYYGVRLVNLSNAPSRNIAVSSGLRRLQVPLPTMLLDETDRFITMPVPKVHANTTISVAIKNQWGVIQIPAQRLKLHPRFKEVIYAVNKALPKPLVVVDGRFGLNRNGPMRGDVVELNWLAVCDNIFANDVIVAKIMGFDPRRIRYLHYAMQKEKIRAADQHVMSDQADISNPKFYLARDFTDLPGLGTFNSRILAWVGYESGLAKPLHKLLYLVRTPFY